MNRIFSRTSFAAVAFGLAVSGLGQSAFRPPAVPLVTFDPYLSIWAEGDSLNSATTRHWTTREHPLVSLLRVDGRAYRLMGTTPAATPAFPQTGLTVTPTQSIYTFANGSVSVTLTFTTAALPNDLNRFSRPLSYLTWDVRSVDGALHQVELFDSVSGQLTVNDPKEPVTWGRERAGSLTALRIGTVAQPVLGSAGDDHRINWGHAYLAVPSGAATTSIGSSADEEAAFVTAGRLSGADDSRMPRAADDAAPVLAAAFDLGRVGAKPVSRHALVAYDEIYAIEYFRYRLRPYWRRHGTTAAKMLAAADRDYVKTIAACTAFDRELTADMTRVGGAKYAQIAATSYRECVAACGLAADEKGQPLFFTKENTSNGDIATVDVFFPMDPVWVMLSPTLAKATLVPILDYAASSHWKFPNAPHDLGTYPLARGTDDGGEGMPVEESGNMLILVDAIAQAEGSPKFADRWWPQLSQWAKYLEAYGLDPEDQLCTDDFMGHLAHNANLSVKAILALAAYADLAQMRGDTVTADRFLAEARTDARHWIKVAADGDHSRLAFDKPNSWSQKYNLVWDRILGLNVFPASVAAQEVAYYKTVMQRYGVPLDSRTKLTKTDWSYWSATLAERAEDFATLTDPIYDYVTATTARDPIADSYITDDIRSGGMHARPVVGGFFIKMLADRPTWLKWARRDRTKVGPWASFPVPPVITSVIPTSQRTPINWRYTTERPVDGWFLPSFDASGWNEGPALFGTVGGPRTDWKTDDIWIRREFTMPDGKFGDLQFTSFHDEDVEIYINGVFAGSETGYTTAYELIKMTPAARALLVPGAKISIAAHCHQTTGGQGIDIGIVEVKERG